MTEAANPPNLSQSTLRKGLFHGRPRPFLPRKLLNVAHGNTGQSRRVANFLLAWWNAADLGGFDLTDLASLDLEICEDMATVFTWLAREEVLSYPDAYKPEIVEIIRRWRPRVEIGR